MKHIILFLLCICISIPVLANDSVEEITMPCYDYDILVDLLAENHNEHIIFRSLSSDGFILEIYKSSINSNYTMIIMYPDEPEIACILDTGHYSKVYDNFIIGTDI
jgi:hypothetical protein